MFVLMFLGIEKWLGKRHVETVFSVGKNERHIVFDDEEEKRR